MEETGAIPSSFASITVGTQTKQARGLLIEQGQVPEGLLREHIHRSWNRCLDQGLDPGRPRPIERLQQYDLTEARERNFTLLAQARPLMDSLYEQIADSRSMVILTDPEGLILHSIGDPDFVSKAQRVALQAGVSWAEAMRGTNAIGTAAVEQVPVLVNGSEHFLDRNGFLTCSASPIFDHRGDMAGILDISGDHRNYHRHTLALVRMSTQMIERRLLFSKLSGELVMYFHKRQEFMGTLSEGVIAFAESGELLGATQTAALALGLSAADLRKHRFEKLFDFPLEAALGHAVRGLCHSVPVISQEGHAFFANFQAGADLSRRRAPAEHRTPETKERTRPVTRAAPLTFDSLSFGDLRMQTAIERARRVVGRDIAILIEGESGVGKELFAKAFHDSGPRRDSPFVAVNCAAIPDGLIESELFGYDEGAFTGARRRGSAGRIQQADGGTLFLDEIGDMPMQLQSRLLRVLQDRLVTPLGTSKSFRVDISLICATHRRLREEVAKGTFREDLYYRLNGLRFSLPPLRARSDLHELMDAMLREEQGECRRVSFSPEVISAFEHYSWPGNLRQLANVIRAALALVGSEQVIRSCHLPEDFLEEIEDNCNIEDGKHKAEGVPTPGSVALSGNLGELEVRAIRKALDDHGGNVSAAARRLGISRNTLYRKLGRF
jgi:sigma-54 dependent transcriptional regulator, acetoin dehydrogenase operon transcriptional activator AcoR